MAPPVPTVCSAAMGNDLYIVDNLGDQVTEAAGKGTDTVQSAVNFTLGADIENLTLTGAAVSGTGNTLGNIINGNAAANTLDGAAGADSLSGGDGNDTYIVDNIGDQVTEAAGKGTDTVQSSVSFILGADVENLTLTGTAISGTGNAGINTITGNASANTLDGAAGADNLIGGDGDDTYIVDDLGDDVTELAGKGTRHGQVGRQLHPGRRTRESDPDGHGHHRHRQYAGRTSSPAMPLAIRWMAPPARTASSAAMATIPILSMTSAIRSRSWPPTARTRSSRASTSPWAPNSRT